MRGDVKFFADQTHHRDTMQTWSDVGFGLHPARPTFSDALRRSGAAGEALLLQLAKRSNILTIYVPRSSLPRRPTASRTSELLAVADPPGRPGRLPILVIEHNLDVMDGGSIMDLGPEGGSGARLPRRRQILEAVAGAPESYMRQFLGGHFLRVANDLHRAASGRPTAVPR